MMLWTSGLIAGALIGGGACGLSGAYDRIGFEGMVAGMATFTCLRLWLTDTGKPEHSKS